MWTVHWNRQRQPDQKSWQADGNISSEAKALRVTKAMLRNGWVVYTISRNGQKVWNEAQIAERCGKPLGQRAPFGSHTA